MEVLFALKKYHGAYQPNAPHQAKVEIVAMSKVLKLLMLISQ
ncbi:hypothetical protein I3842_Q106000 [Carya illinoinensis]|uniref:Uncharacterized protein n=1 Tax=Carya illinoinensis TaxID=32201 RepID=A0A922D2G0_CARIL|nr:hypothetical protein I3842_Q106000 [Carya illinoinensis]